MKVAILIADDDKQIRDLLSEFLKNHGYQVDAAKGVRSAIRLMGSNDYDIILTDKNMPDEEGHMEGGMTVLRYAKEHKPLTEVIMITGQATVETAIEAIKLGAFDYIMKPISLDELKEKIDRVMEYRRFIRSEDTLQTYRALHNQVLNSLANKDNLPEDGLQQMLRSLGAKIDHVFGLQGDYETIIEMQAEALVKIEDYAEHLKEAIPCESPCYPVVEKISEESKKRI